MESPVRLGSWPGASVLLALAVALAGCGLGASATQVRPEVEVSPPPSAPSTSTDLTSRLVAIDDAVNAWRSALDLAAARHAAEAARNLVVGPSGPLYGDADGNGSVDGASEIGLLPGLGGEPGLATPAAGECVDRDVLGGSWEDPAARWSTLQSAIGAWSETNNTFPSLPSHPQRIVGWATLALDAPDLAPALEYGGHAHLHIDISRRAASACAG